MFSIPNTFSLCALYIICVDAKKGGEEAADRAEELLREMEDSYNHGDLDLRPNIKTYCAVISEYILLSSLHWIFANVLRIFATQK